MRHGYDEGIIEIHSPFYCFFTVICIRLLLVCVCNFAPKDIDPE